MLDNLKKIPIDFVAGEKKEIKLKDLAEIFIKLPNDASFITVIRDYSVNKHFIIVQSESFPPNANAPFFISEIQFNLARVPDVSDIDYKEQSVIVPKETIETPQTYALPNNFDFSALMPQQQECVHDCFYMGYMDHIRECPLYGTQRGRR